MRLRHIPGAEEQIAESPYVIQTPQANKGRWAEAFGSGSPIQIEVGMGKGKFLMELAAANPNINYVGIEMYSSVLLKAIQKRKDMELPNLWFLRVDARNLADIFGPGEVEKIYLNFSDPWPKDRHAKRRLPSKEFLARYDRILKKDGILEFKTDNRALFEFALEELPEAVWKADFVTYELHREGEKMKSNIMTEYEEKFSLNGNPIYKYEIKR